MSKLLLLREPGYVYDLEFIFCLHFNFDLYVSMLPDDENKKENVKYYKHVLSYFGEIPDDLYVFFHALPSTERTFLLSYSFYPHQEYFTTTYNFTYIQKEIRKKSKLIRSLLKFYFIDLDDEKIDYYLQSVSDLFTLIKNSNYSKDEKIKLYEFFSNPYAYIELLDQELTKKEFMLSDYYRNNFYKVLNVYNQSDINSLQEDLEGLFDFNSVYKYNQNSFVSYCLINMAVIYFCNPANQEFISLLGFRYSLFLDFLKNKENKPDMMRLGVALSEESRIKLLYYILENEDVTCKELEQSFEISGSTVYHHLNVMVRAGLLKVRNEGRNIIYSIDKRYFDNVIYTLSKFSNKWKGKQNEKILESPFFNQNKQKQSY